MVTTATSGFWQAAQGPNDQGANVCMILTGLPSLGASLAIITSDTDQRLHVIAMKSSWNIPE